jgi:hypothetical protein
LKREIHILSGHKLIDPLPEFFYYCLKGGSMQCK